MMFDPKKVHEDEQSQAALKQAAGFIANMYRGLVDEGIPPKEAAMIVGSYFAALMSGLQK